MRIRRLNRVGAKPSDDVVPVYEIREDSLSKHRTCWKHFVRYSRDTKKRLRKEEIDKIQSAAPCFYEKFPHGKRSVRRVRCKYVVSKLRKKLDSETFTRYLEDLWNSFSEDKKTSFMCLDSIWFSLYRDPAFRTKVIAWITRKHIFLKKYVFVPIVCWSHWNLLILCNFGEGFGSKSKNPCMLLLDSLQMTDPKRLEPDIRKFVLDIYRAEGRTSDLRLISKIPLLVPKVPQQRNDEECGSFVLYYINLFMRDAPDDFSSESYPYFMEENWFTLEDLEDFRSKLDALATKLS